MIAQLAAIVAPVLICAALGFAWVRLGRPFDTDLVTSLVMYIGTPCLIVTTFIETAPSPDAFAEIALATLAAYAGFSVLGIAVLSWARLSYRDYLPALVFPNAGNMGLPLCLFAFGDRGLALGIVFFAVSAVLNFTFGISIVQGSARPGDILRMPLIYAVGLALFFMFSDATPPEWFRNTIGLIGGLTIPLMLLTLGAALSRLSMASLGRSLALSLVRLGGGFAVGLGVAELLDLEGTLRGVLILQSSMAPAVYAYLFAERFGRGPGEVAGIVLVSTILSVVTLPVLLLYLL